MYESDSLDYIYNCICDKKIKKIKIKKKKLKNETTFCCHRGYTFHENEFLSMQFSPRRELGAWADGGSGGRVVMGGGGGGRGGGGGEGTRCHQVMHVCHSSNKKISVSLST